MLNTECDTNYESSSLSPQTNDALRKILDRRYTFNDHVRFVHTTHADGSVDVYEDTNDGRGATLVGVMVIAVVAGLLGFLVGLSM
jgi:hypothetical protein